MEGIYLENKSMAYFIAGYKDNTFVEISSSAASIAASAFAYSDAEKVLFKNCSPDIGEKAFEECEELTTVIFGELGKNGTAADKGNSNSANCETKIGKSILKNVKLVSAGDDFTIQANAFKDCAKLATLVLPQVDDEHKLVIEKDAFSGCRALHTVVAICKNIDFTGNPFVNDAECLTFVCKKDSDVARFARENGYGSVYVD